LLLRLLLLFLEYSSPDPFGDIGLGVGIDS
jgi:hypothetical protein